MEKLKNKIIESEDKIIISSDFIIDMPSYLQKK